MNPTIIERKPLGLWDKAVRLRFGAWEIGAPLSVGPRILRCGPIDGPNLFYECPGDAGKGGGDKWRIFGGHRLWSAPEDPECYRPDNEEVGLTILRGRGFVLSSTKTKKAPLHKSIRVEQQGGSLIKIEHRLRNDTRRPLALSPWALTAVRPGGTVLVPQPDYVPHPSEMPKGRRPTTGDFWPNRTVSLWPFTDLNDPRVQLGRDMWELTQQARRPAWKIGLRHAIGWVGWQWKDYLFAKWIEHDVRADYPDGGVNCELYTCNDFTEIESLAPARTLAVGATAVHREWWHLAKRRFKTPRQAGEYVRNLPDPRGQ